MDEKDIARIELGSRAWHYLQDVLNDPKVYKIAIYNGSDGFKVKANEWTWTAPLATSNQPKMGV